MNKPTRTPRWANRLLRKFADPNTLEEVEGDLDEFMLLWERTYGIRKARIKYTLTVLTLLRPFRRSKKNNVRNNSTLMMYTMIWSYFKISWRNILKNKVSFFINISGLTVGLATSIIIYLVVRHEFQYDRFHARLPDIYMLMKNQSTNDGISTGTSSAGPVAEALRDGFPEVEHAARVAGFDSKQVMVNNTISYENGIFADPDLFEMMTFPTVNGDPLLALQNNTSIVITKDMAKKLFANEQALGKSLLIDKRSFTVGAVIENIPATSSIKFDMVIPFSVFERDNTWLKKWDDNRIHTWIQLTPNADLVAFNDKATKLLQGRTNDTSESLFAYPLSELYLHGGFSNGYPDGGRITGIKILVGFGIFMLLIACVNFVNIATAQTEHRAKEIGVRKVLGASRWRIIFQFLNESFFISFISLFVAIAVSLSIIPYFNTLTHSAIHFDVSNPWIWTSAVAIGIITGLLAGTYPAFFLSRFIPVRVLKGRVAYQKGGGLRKGLVTFQFSISIFVLISTIIMYAQFEHVKNRPLGYEQENLVKISLDSTLKAKFAYIKYEVLKNSNVKAAAGTDGNILYSRGSVTGMDWPGKKPGQDLSVAVTSVGYEWSKTMGIKMIQGRDFDAEFPSDGTACLINESAVTKMGLENPVGSVVGGHTVIGVFQNFVYNNPFGQISPMAVYLNSEHPDNLYVRVQNNSEWSQTLKDIGKITAKISPDFPFSPSFTRDEYQRRFEEISDTSLMISIFGVMTIFISCLGLFGLSGFVAEKRGKEMSIRKVFGATGARILLSLTKDFLKPVAYALLLVIPLTMVVAQRALSMVSYRVELRWWMFASGGLLILAIVSVIVLYQGWQTASENPVVRLRNE